VVRVVCDIEADDLDNPKNIWVIVCKDIDTGELHVFRPGDKDWVRNFIHFAKSVTLWIGHNFLVYDIGVISRLLGYNIHPLEVLDTLVISKLLWYNIPNGHSLEAWGERLGIPKDTFNDFSKYSEELELRCIKDTEITLKLYNYFKGYLKDSWKSSVEIEHFMSIICKDIHENGFKFNLKEAKELHERLRQQLQTLDQEIKEAFPPRSKLKREVVPRATARGTLHLGDFRWLEGNDLSSYSVGCPFSVIDWVEFNPGSPSQIVERLNEAGWEPTEKTKSGKSYKISEINLLTVPDTAPRATQKLVQRLFIASRCRRSLEWINAASEAPRGSQGLSSNYGRIHGTFNSIGCWTHRMSHTNPNMGNVPSVSQDKYSSSFMKELSVDLSKQMRSLWIVDSDKMLVGCDAEGIQLRIFAHYVNDNEFTTALVSGNSKDGTDAHSLNATVLGEGTTRAQAKRFIYAFLLGVGVAKTSSIFNCSVGEAKERIGRFVARYPGLQNIREHDIPRDVKRGYFEGFDGRKVIIPEDKREGNVNGFVLGGYLQNGEACIMKHANVLWRRELVRDGIWFRQVNFVHDEWQTEVYPDSAKQVGETQSDSIKRTGELFNLRCPMGGSYKIGRNWYETH
jgi:DNA polymerase-1